MYNKEQIPDGVDRYCVSILCTRACVFARACVSASVCVCVCMACQSGSMKISCVGGVCVCAHMCVHGVSEWKDEKQMIKKRGVVER